MHDGRGNCLKYLKGGGEKRKRRFKKDGGKLGQGMGALKRGNCVLSRSLGSTSEGSKISLSQALG